MTLGSSSAKKKLPGPLGGPGRPGSSVALEATGGLRRKSKKDSRRLDRACRAPPGQGNAPGDRRTPPGARGAPRERRGVPRARPPATRPGGSPLPTEGAGAGQTGSGTGAQLEMTRHRASGRISATATSSLISKPASFPAPARDATWGRGEARASVAPERTRAVGRDLLADILLSFLTRSALTVAAAPRARPRRLPSAQADNKSRITRYIGHPCGRSASP